MNINLIAMRCIPASLLIASGSVVASAQDAAKPLSATTLQVGDPAPPVSGVTWIKGPPLTSFTDGKVHVLEFWATWCGPCKAAMPHLSALAAQFKGEVDFYGIDVRENQSGDSGVDYMTKVKRFVNYARGMMSYNVGADDPSGTMFSTWFRAAGLRGIPATFVVDKQGKIAYIGNPYSLGNVLPLVLQSKFDASRFTAERKAASVNGEASYAQYEQAKQSGDFKKALQYLDDYDKSVPAMWDRTGIWKYDLLALSGSAAAHFFGEELVKKTWNSPAQLLTLSGIILGHNSKVWGGIQNPDYELALKAAQMAAKCIDPMDIELNETLAEAYFKAGDRAKAAEYQERVVMAYETDKTIRPQDATLAEAKAKLESYRAAKQNKDNDSGAQKPGGNL